MNLRRRINQEPLQFQLAPMIDVILFLLCFFLLTWNLARYEQDLEVKVPVARHGAPPKELPGEVIINLKSDGSVELERTTISFDQLEQKLSAIEQVYPDQAVVLRGSENVEYKWVVKVLDVCHAAKLTNIAFATNRPEKEEAQ
ncbi:MAG TPA: biopolymer transporter ExbD [Candidatus Methylacidiphilales bacterium]|jgi:biopolymer transport protein ExbD|nr:biopolymer transporter ExbD [Candidatus Methylacidiphilales bacterium]